MMGVRIITDSTSDISIEEAGKMGLAIVPLKVIFGNTEYKEGIEISMEGFYEKLVTSEKLPTTSQPAPDDFLEQYLKAKEAGDSVVVVLIAGKLSGTFQSAIIAKEMAEYSQIYVVDSLTSIIGLRLLVEHAVNLVKQGLEAIQIAKTLEELKERIVLFAMVDTLEYLHKGGRLSKSSAIIGSLLNFKPIITLKDGAIQVVGKERGTNKGLARILEAIDEFGAIDQNYSVNFGFTAEDSKSLLLKEKVIDKYALKNYGMYPVGCVVGVHVGPGACMIAYIKQ